MSKAVDGEIDLAGAEYPPSTSVKLNGPPGTGKTTQLLERVTRLLDGDYHPSDITFVTYRKEMAAEFLRRLHERGYISQEEYEKPWENDTRHFGTLHGVCNRITSDAEVVEKKHRRKFMLKEYEAKYDGKADWWDSNPKQRDPIGTLLFEAYDWCVENKQHSFIRAPNYAEVKDVAISPPSFEDFSQAWHRYMAGGNEEGEVLRDFAGMLREVDEGGLRPSGSILVVDEYHDMTPIMASICEGWMESFDTVIVGGDPLQAVYSYKGADPSFFTDLDYPEVVLDRTYRVPENIWEYAKTVIDHDTPDVEPDSSGGTIRSVTGTPPRVVEKYGEESTMFLARTQSQLHDIASDLKSEGIIFRSQDRIGGWNTSNILFDLFNALQKLEGVQPADNVDPETGQTGMARYDEAETASSVRLPSNVSLSGGEAKHLVSKTPAGYFTDTKKSVKSFVKGTGGLTGTELLQRVEPSFWTDMTRGVDSVDNLLTYNAKTPLKKALERYDSAIEDIASAPVPDVLTIHASKGKEAETVALYDGIPNAVQENIHRDPVEQRAESRVWYVGVTRAADTLLVFPNEFDYVDHYLPYDPIN